MPPEAARGPMNAMNEVFIIPHNVRLGGDLITKAGQHQRATRLSPKVF